MSDKVTFQALGTSSAESFADGEEKPLVSEEFSLKNAKLIDTVLSEIGYY